MISTFGQFYPKAKPGKSLCKTCVKRGWDCIKDQVYQDIFECKQYAEERK